MKAFAAAEALWREWNARINVISRKDEDNIYAHHILHSLAIAEYLRRFYPEDYASMSAADCPDGVAQARPDSRGRATRGTEAGGPPAPAGGGVSEANSPGARPGHCATVLDVGTGGGFPGIPLAMTLPAASFTLCDSIGKKVRVAQAVAEGLGLQNVSCVQSRVEDLPGEWDWVVSRAVTSLENFYPWVRGRYRRSILYLKGGDIASEISALQRRFHIPATKIRTWAIAPWIAELTDSSAESLQEYYAEKYVIEISK